MVGTKQGVWRTRSIRRKPIGDRWSRSNIDHIVGVPWLPNRGEGGDLEDVGGGVRVMDKEYRERIRQVEAEHEAQVDAKKAQNSPELPKFDLS